MENTGVTPATHVTSHCNYQRMDAPMTPNFDFPDQWYSDEPQSRQEMGIRPKSHVLLPCTGIPIPDLCALRNDPNDTYLYWWGYVKYRDIFGTSDQAPERLTQFCNRITDPADSCFDAKTPGSVCTVTISSCRSGHNRFDNECDQKKPRTTIISRTEDYVPCDRPVTQP
jgi:hypothetical protein